MNAMDATTKLPRGMGPRKPRPREQPNALREWLEQFPPPMRKLDFAKKIGCTPSYISMLVADTAPLPNSKIIGRIVKVTNGAVTAEALARSRPGIR